MQNKLYFSESLILDDSTIYGGVNYELNINPDTDLMAGAVGCAKIEFITDLLTGANIGNTLTYSVKQEIDDDFRVIGTFKVTEVTKQAKDRFRVVAYDSIYNFEKDVSDYIYSINGSITLKNFFTGLCSFIGCTGQSTAFTNSNISFQPSVVYEDNNEVINGREVLSDISEIAGSFIIADTNGNIVFHDLGENSFEITRADYKNIVFADFLAPTVSGIRVKVNKPTGEVDVKYPSNASDTNMLVISDNKILYSDEIEATALNTVLSNIYNKVHSYSYVPLLLNTFSDLTTAVGDELSITVVDSTEPITTYVFSKKWNSSGVTLESTGGAARSNDEKPVYETRANATYTKNKLYSKISQTEADITAIVGQTYETKTHAESTKQELQTTIQQTAQDITSTVASTYETKSAAASTKQELQTTIQQTAQSITSTVASTYETKASAASTKQELKTTISQTESSIYTTVSRNYATISELNVFEEQARSAIIQNAENIEARVTKSGGSYSSFAWNLTSTEFALWAGNTKVFSCTSGGITVNGYATVGSLNAVSGRVGSLESDHVSVGSLNAVSSRVGSLEADHVSVASLNAVDAKFGSLNASNITAGTLSVDRLSSSVLTTSNISGKSIACSGLSVNTASGITSAGSVTCPGVTVNGYYFTPKMITVSGSTFRVLANG